MTGSSANAGWVVFCVQPWRVLGPYASFEQAACVASEQGLDFRICFGRRTGPEDDFAPWPEPDERDQLDREFRAGKPLAQRARPRHDCAGRQ